MSSLPLAVAVVIRHAGRFLLIQRNQEPYRGWWSPVTGRVEAGESLSDAAVREAHEEMGIAVTVGEPFFTCPTTDGSHQLHFLPAAWSGGAPAPSAREVMAWGWYTLAEAETLEHLFASDLVALRELEHR